MRINSFSFSKSSQNHGLNKEAQHGIMWMNSSVQALYQLKVGHVTNSCALTEVLLILGRQVQIVQQLSVEMPASSRQG